MNAITSPLHATIVKPEQALSIKPFGLKVLLTTEATGGAILVLMGWLKPGEGPSDHVHFNQEEIFFIVEGNYEMTQATTTGTTAAQDQRSSSHLCHCSVVQTFGSR